MQFIVLDSKEEASAKAAEIVKEIIKNKPDAVLGLATGSTPLGLYGELIKAYKAGELDFSNVTTVNLDEYVGIGGDHDQSYRYFMDHNLFNHININKENTHVPHGDTKDPAAEAKRYEELLLSLPPQDVQILGVGQNGHIAFNEPAENLTLPTHVETLTDDTIEANSRFFQRKEDVPTKAITMGIRCIMRAKTIILIATGEAKQEAVKNLMNDYISANNPSSVLKLHDNAIIITDKAAYGDN